MPIRYIYSCIQTHTKRKCENVRNMVYNVGFRCIYLHKIDAYTFMKVDTYIDTHQSRRANMPLYLSGCLSLSRARSLSLSPPLFLPHRHTPKPTSQHASHILLLSIHIPISWIYVQTRLFLSLGASLSLSLCVSPPSPHTRIHTSAQTSQHAFLILLVSTYMPIPIQTRLSLSLWRASTSLSLSLSLPLSHTHT